MWPFIALGTVAASIVSLGMLLREVSPTKQGTLNIPPPWYWPRAFRLERVKRDLEEHGAEFSSLFRNKLTNHLVGGVEDSNHQEMLALDCNPRRPELAATLERRIHELEAMGVLDARRTLFHDVGSGKHWHLEIFP